jgi:hypothetical protein
MYDGQIKRENKRQTAFARKFNSGKNKLGRPNLIYFFHIVQASAERICDDEWNMVISYKQWKCSQLFTACNVE